MNQESDQPVKLGIAGAGGYAVSIAGLVQRVGEQCQPRVQLVGVAEPDTTTHAARLAELRGQGIATYPAFDKLLANPDIEAVWLPVPIPLHRPFTERALATGKAVMCEKPAAGVVQDVDAMIAARDRARLPVAIGFQHVYDPVTAQLKRRLVAGDIGTIRQAVLHACWPRSEQYFRRNNWAGRFKQGDAWVMDSPANNALSHFINLALFILGPTLTESAVPVRVEAELYRAHAIENFDTISLRAHLPGGGTLLVLMTHASRDTVGPILRLEGTQGRLSWTYEQIEIEAGGRSECLAGTPDPGPHSLERFARLVRHQPDETRLVSTLESARAQVLVVNAASTAAAIVPVPATQINRSERNGENWVAIAGLESALALCAIKGQMLHESGLLPFTQPAGSLDTQNYRQFAGPRL